MRRDGKGREDEPIRIPAALGSRASRTGLHIVRRGAQEGAVFPPDVAPYGRTYSEWAASWWQWAIEQPTSTNPIIDDTGAQCANEQEGNVWFLAGVQTEGQAKRSCTVPPNTALLVPVSNGFQCRNPREAVDVEGLRDRLLPLQSVYDLYASIDGIAVPDIKCHYYEESEVFEIMLPADNIYGEPAGEYAPCVDAGYYLMVKPLSPGEHVIKFGGKLDDAMTGETNEIDIEYRITVPAP